jgi:hypothetical protein
MSETPGTNGNGRHSKPADDDNAPSSPHANGEDTLDDDDDSDLSAPHPDSELWKIAIGNMVSELNTFRAVTDDATADRALDLLELGPSEFKFRRGELEQMPPGATRDARDARKVQVGTLLRAFVERIGHARKKRAAETDTDTNGQGRPLDLQPPEPWPYPVDGHALVADLGRFFQRHAILPAGGLTALVLWTIHTYCYVLWRYTPRLHVTGPTKRCGKSRVLRLLELTVCKPLAAANISMASVFRSVEAAHPTLLLDEADQSVKEKPDLTSILNGGYERGQMVIRTVGDDHEPRMFDLFAPVALAGIGSLSGTLEDRSIRLPMRRALPTEKTAKITTKAEAHGKELQRKIARWVADHAQVLAAATPDVSKLPDRVDDHWTPLYAIADAIGGSLPAHAAAAVGQLTPRSGGSEYDSLGEQALADTRTVFTDAAATELPTHEIVGQLVNMEDRPWGDLEDRRGGGALTVHRYTRIMGRFGVLRRRLTVQGKSGPWGYRLSDFADAFGRYLDV